MGYPVDIKTTNIVTATTTTVKSGSARILGLSMYLRMLQQEQLHFDDTTAVWVFNTPATDTTTTNLQLVEK